MGKISYATEETLNDIISEGTTLVDFYANWCAPCRAMSPVLETLSELDDYKDINFVKVDIDENSALAVEYKISSIPSLKIFTDGEIVEELVGFLPEETLKEVLDKYI